jgi:hypothetical protein
MYDRHYTYHIPYIIDCVFIQSKGLQTREKPGCELNMIHHSRVNGFRYFML